MTRKAQAGCALACAALLIASGAAVSGEPGILRPKDFGAVGDGRHDDTKALQSLLDHTKKFPTSATIDLGKATYRVAGSRTNPGLPSSILTLGGRGRLPKSLRIIGTGATIVVNQKTEEPILLVLCAFQSFSVEGVTFQREEVCAPGDQFQGGGGVYLTDIKPSQDVSEVRFASCTFINCHRAITAISQFADLTSSNMARPYYQSAGKMQQLIADHCSFLYPYGSNSTLSTGGGQAFYSGYWTQTTSVTNCTFDGATHGVHATPNGLPKDGFIFGEPLNLVATGNLLRNFWVEGIRSDFQRGSIMSLKPFTLPAPGETVQIQTDRCAELSALKPGHHLVLPEAGEFSVVSTSRDGAATLRLEKPWRKGAVTVQPGRFLLPVQSRGQATCSTNRILGTPVAGFSASPNAQGTANPGIRIDNISAIISKNIIVGAKGIMLTAPEATDPSCRKSYQSEVSDNTITLFDSSQPIDHKVPAAAVGISIYQPGVSCRGNVLALPSDHNASGYKIVVPNPTVSISKDSIFVLNPQPSPGVGSPSTGVEIGNIDIPRANRGVRIDNTTFSNVAVAIRSNTAPVDMDAGNTFVNVGTAYAGPGASPAKPSK